MQTLRKLGADVVFGVRLIAGVACAIGMGLVEVVILGGLLCLGKHEEVRKRTAFVRLDTPEE